jgi:hypothetical protein
MLVTVVSASLLAPFAVVAVSSHLIGIDLRVDALALFLRLALLIGGCVLAARHFSLGGSVLCVARMSSTPRRSCCC